MRFPKSRVVLGVVLFLTLASSNAWAHWCDDLWSSGYDIVVKPDSDTSPKQLYVENRWGYQLTNFKLTATSSSGGTITLTPPTTLKVANTLLPGEKGIWKITAGSPAKVEDLTFRVTFGNTSGTNSKQYACYPVLDASPVMVVKNDGSLFPTAIKGIPTGASDLPKPNTANGCTFGDVSLGRSLQEQTIADWEDLNVGLDNLMTLYCAGRGSWAGDDRTVAANANCKNATSTSCPTGTKPASATVSRGQYMRLWGAGALAIRKGSLGDRLPVLRQRLQCGANDGDTGVAGYTLFVLGYLGDDSGAKSFLQTQASASGDLGTIAKAALYLMGDTTQKSAVQAGAQSSSFFVKVACAGALGIVDKDDASVTSVIIPQVQWKEPDDMGGDSGEDGKSMYAAHILEIVAFDRRGWVFGGNGDGPVTFYGETGGGAGGTSGSGGTSGTGGTSGPGGTSGIGGAVGSGGTSGRAGSGGTAGAVGSDGTSGGGGSGGRSGSGGMTGGAGGSPGSGGSPGVGGATNNGGQGAGGAEPQGSGGAAGSGSAGVSGSGGRSTAGGSSGNGGSPMSSGGNGGGKTGEGGGQSSGCKCSLGGRPEVTALWFPALAGMALLLVRRRRH